MIRPMHVPPNTPKIVRIVNRFSLKNDLHFELTGIFQKGMDIWMKVGGSYGYEFEFKSRVFFLIQFHSMAYTQFVK